MTPTAAINVDVDGLYLYDRIHGHAGTAGNAAGFDPAAHDAVMWRAGIERFLSLFGELGLSATFFVVAQDLAHPEVQAGLARMVAAGHEIGSHSLTHPYDLSRQAAAALDVEVGDARKRLQDASGQPVRGFRAPGYVTSPALLAAVARAGHRYDSSNFRCPPYQLAKALAIGLYRLRGRPSGSIPESPRVWFGRPEPHRVHTADGPLIELPIPGVGPLRMPLIGTSIAAGGEPGLAALLPFARLAPWLNIELHAIDLVGIDEDGLPDRLAVQPEQRATVSQRLSLFARCFDAVRRTHAIKTLDEVAATL